MTDQLKRNKWYRIASSHENEVMQTTEAMKVPSGVLVKTTIVTDKGCGVSTAFVPDVGIQRIDNHTAYGICAGSTNEAV
jgi:hypothetical protein